jgi:tetratricopeptide (TPR) repeat protein
MELPRNSKKCLNHSIRKFGKKNNTQIIDELTDLIIKHPLTPILKNFLSVAYSIRGNNKKAQEVNEWILTEYPNYLFAIINKANALIEKENFEEAELYLGKGLEIKELYPHRDLFHLSEVSSYYLVVIRYLCAIGNIELAENRLEVLEEINPDGSEVEKADQYILNAKYLKEFEETNQLNTPAINTSFAGKKMTSQTNSTPVFNHQEIEWLYTNDCEISEDKIDAIVALPRITLIQDLEAVLKDAANRYDYFLESDFDSNKTYFPIHAIFFLTEISATESLPAILEFLSYDEAFIQFWLDDFLCEQVWYCFFVLGKEQLPVLKNFLLQPNIYSFAKSEVSVALQQMSIHYPEMQEDLYLIYKELYTTAANATIDENIEDETFLALSIHDAFRCNFSSLLPLIKELFDKDYIDESACGDYEEVVNDFETEDYIQDQRKIKNLKEFYANVVNDWYSNNIQPMQTNAADEFDDYELIDEDETPILPIRTEPKIGRNDPCPCGSGKKYKKCCLN